MSIEPSSNPKTAEEEFADMLNTLLIEHGRNAIILHQKVKTARGIEREKVQEEIEAHKESKKQISELKFAYTSIKQINKLSNAKGGDDNSAFKQLSELAKTIRTNQGSIVTVVPKNENQQ